MQSPHAGPDISHTHRYDALIVGSGLVGSWVAKELVEAGLDVLMLEAGPRLEPDEVSDTKAWNPWRRRQAARRQPIQIQNAAWASNPQLFVDDFDNPYVVTANTPFTWIRGRQVGGRSLTWGGVTLRFSDHEFRGPERDGIGPRWPITYADLAPFYDKVERFLGVSGSRDGLTQLPDGVFLPPARFTERERVFKTRVEERWSDRRVIIGRGVALEGRPTPGQDARWSPRSALHAVLPAASAAGLLTVRPDSVVSHLSVDTDTARSCGAVVVDRRSKEPFEVRGRTIVLCASTIESVRILLNSRTRQHPAGIGNSSGLLGRGLVDHMAVYLGGELPATQRSPTLYPFGGPHSISLPRFRNLAPAEKHAFTRGYGIWGHVGRGGSLDQQPWVLTALLEVLSRDDNTIEIDESVTDAWGVKSARIRLGYSENEWSMSEDAVQTLTELADAADLPVGHHRVSTPGHYVHELGGARMGTQPSRSVLNPFNQCWDADNVFVVDGACFPSSGWQNPTLTMMALAARACGQLIAEVRRGHL